MTDTCLNQNSGIFQSIVLHAHLPYVRHPQQPRFFEENWLFEAISECYIPLIKMLDRLEADKIPGKLTFTLTPTLCAMLQDETLLSKYSGRLAELCSLSTLLASRRHSAREWRQVADFYQQHFRQLQHFFEDVCNRDLIREFIRLRDCGRIEIIGCAATHALLALSEDRRMIRAQILTGLDAYIETFNMQPAGIWMPECAYTPLISEIIADAGIAYSIVDSHGIIHGTPMPRYSVFAPVRDHNGLVLFGRDPESSRQVWSADTGYPGDFAYREFYRDYGWDGNIAEIGEYLVSPDIRHDLGLKFHRITGNIPLDQKAIYNPETARERAIFHGRHFTESRISQGRRLLADCDNCVHILSPYDAELFGHWWFEGPVFLESVLRTAAEGGLQMITPAEYLQLNRPLQQLEVGISSWGNNGYFETWLNGSNDWIYRQLQRAEERMQHLCAQTADGISDDARNKALQQAGRELLLAQASDWAFILTTGTTTEYACRRVNTHLQNFRTICDMLETGTLDTLFIEELFAENSIFPNLDYSVFI